MEKRGSDKCHAGRMTREGVIETRRPRHGDLPVFLAAGMAVPGLPVPIYALLLCFTLGIMGIITPYATGPSPVYFGSGFVSRKHFWILGTVFGAIFLIALLVIGTP